MRTILHHPVLQTHAHQFFRFAFCGSVGAFIDLGTLTLLVEKAGVDPHIAAIPSTLLAVVFVFLANKYFTFRNREKRYARQGLKFALVYGAAIFFNVGTTWALLSLGIYYFLAKVIAIGVGILWNYSLSHAFVFRKGEEEVVVL